MPNARSSSGLRSRKRAGLPSRSSTSARLTRSSASLASLSLPLAFLARLSTRFSMLSRSASISSVSMVSMSASGAILPSTWVMSESSKQRTTWAMASTSRMLARNWLPKPSPLEAPRTRPAISTKVSRVGMICADFADIRLDGAERIVGRLSRRRFRQRVEQCRLADIGQADDTAFESHIASRNPFAMSVAVRGAVIALVQKSLGLQRQVHLVRERGVLPGREHPRIVGDHLAQRLHPGPVGFRKVRQHVRMHQFLDAGMTDAEPHPAIVVADMR